jgi:small subunit ribosomal protein S1
MSWTKKVTHPNELLKKGDTVKCVVLEVDRDKQRVSLGASSSPRTRGSTPSPSTTSRHGRPRHGHQDHQLRRLRRARADLEGLLHISELADHKVENPQDVVKAGDEVDVKILRVDTPTARSASRSSAPSGAMHRRAAAAARTGRPRRASFPTRGGMDAHDAMGTDKIPECRSR